jgi:hypothetical protein
MLECLDLDRLAEMLHRGNSGVPHLFREAFYGAKTFLLSAFGTPLEHDVQRIDDACFSCDGTGVHAYQTRYAEDCWKCRGTGVFRTRFIWLDKFRLGPYTFHSPVSGVIFRGTPAVSIKGRIEHTRYEDSTDCALTLAWLFNRDALRRQAEYLAESTIEISGDGPGSHAVRMWMRDKRLADAKAWKEECEKRVDSCPF